jgi:hypothetical protein
LGAEVHSFWRRTGQLAFQGATEAVVGSSRTFAAFVVGQETRSAKRSHLYLSGIGSLRKERSVAGMLLEKEMEWLRGQDGGRSETRRLQAANNWPSLRLLSFLLLSIMPWKFFSGANLIRQFILSRKISIGA